MQCQCTATLVQQWSELDDDDTTAAFHNSCFLAVAAAKKGGGSERYSHIKLLFSTLQQNGGTMIAKHYPHRQHVYAVATA